jgi:hypothetical protein
LRATGSAGEINFGSTGGGSSKGGIIQGGEIFRHGAVSRGVELIECRDPALTMRVRHDHAGIDGSTPLLQKGYDKALTSVRGPP